jgi:hypothetical protein
MQLKSPLRKHLEIDRRCRIGPRHKGLIVQMRKNHDPKLRVEHV